MLLPEMTAADNQLLEDADADQQAHVAAAGGAGGAGGASSSSATDPAADLARHNERAASVLEFFRAEADDFRSSLKQTAWQRHSQGGQARGSGR